MDLENGLSKETYVLLLNEVLSKKAGILEQIRSLTLKQEQLLSAEPFEEDGFDLIIREKEELIKELDKFDSGFERIYDSVRAELASNTQKYTDTIRSMQEKIARITDMAVELQVLEKRNRAKAEIAFSKKKAMIKNARISSQTASSYYKSMTSHQESQSYFYDKKK